MELLAAHQVIICSLFEELCLVLRTGLCGKEDNWNEAKIGVSSKLLKMQFDLASLLSAAKDRRA